MQWIKQEENLNKNQIINTKNHVRHQEIIAFEIMMKLL